MNKIVTKNTKPSLVFVFLILFFVPVVLLAETVILIDMPKIHANYEGYIIEDGLSVLGSLDSKESDFGRSLFGLSKLFREKKPKNSVVDPVDKRRSKDESKHKKAMEEGWEVLGIDTAKAPTSNKELCSKSSRDYVCGNRKVIIGSDVSNKDARLPQNCIIQMIKKNNDGAKAEKGKDFAKEHAILDNCIKEEVRKGRYDSFIIRSGFNYDEPKKAERRELLVKFLEENRIYIVVKKKGDVCKFLVNDVKCDHLFGMIDDGDVSCYRHPEIDWDSYDVEENEEDDDDLEDGWPHGCFVGLLYRLYYASWW